MIYLASPWSHSDAEVRRQRYEAAVKATAALINAGRMVYSPIVYSHHLAESGKLGGDWADWVVFDTWFIERCSFVWILTLDGWEQSKGVQAEIDLAAELGKPMQKITLEECLAHGRR